MPAADIAWADLGDDRAARWAETWQALGWTVGDPRGSSRLLELAMGQAVRDGDVAIALRAAFDALGHAEGPPSRGLPWQVRLLWIALRPAAPPAFPLPERLTPSQRVFVEALYG